MIFNYDKNIVKENSSNNENKSVNELKALEVEFENLCNTIQKDNSYEKFVILYEEIKNQEKDLNATKTETVSSTHTESTPATSMTMIPMNGSMFPSTKIEYVSKTKTYYEKVEVADEQKRQQAKNNIAELEKQLSKLPNVEKNKMIYNLLKDTEKLSEGIRLLESCEESSGKSFRGINIQKIMCDEVKIINWDKKLKEYKEFFNKKEEENIL